jgi:hypothetical protein
MRARLTLTERAVRFADFVRMLHKKGILTISQTKNALDRFAFKLERNGQTQAAELVSAVYMTL